MAGQRTMFTRLVDELVEFSDGDPELAEGLRWLDGEAQRRGITLYDMVFEALYRHDADVRARDWMRTRN